MQRHALAVVSAIVTIAACTPEPLPPGALRQTAASAPSVDRASDPTVKGPVTSIFATYSASAPSNRVQLVMRPNVRFVFNNQLRNRLAIDVADSSVQQVVSELKRLAWVTSVVVTGHNPAREVGTFRHVTFGAARLALRRSDAIPWGVHFTNADRVQSAFSNTGSGVKVGVLDSGIDCDNWS